MSLVTAMTMGQKFHQLFSEIWLLTFSVVSWCLTHETTVGSLLVV